VCCNKVDAVGRLCRWRGRQDQLNGHQHVFSQATQINLITAHKRTAEENHDEAPPAKAASVDASTQTSSAAAGTAGVENDSSSVRDTAASVPDRHQPGTDDDHDIRANTADDHEDSHGDEDHDETQA